MAIGPVEEVDKAAVALPLRAFSPAFAIHGRGRLGRCELRGRQAKRLESLKLSLRHAGTARIDERVHPTLSTTEVAGLHWGASMWVNEP